jgi:DNA replication and repair protein RecF
VRVERLEVRDFRSYAYARCALSDGVTVLVGPNGAGKTNLLEALYVGCSGRSARTRNDRELVRLGAEQARVTLHTSEGPVPHVVNVTLTRGERKAIRVDGRHVDGAAPGEARPFVCVFMPDRLSLLKGPPALRRAHLDELVRALWPARANDRREYARALSQRNALLAAVRAGRSGRESLPAWDSELATHAMQLRGSREKATAALAGPLRDRARELGLPGDLIPVYRPGARAADSTLFLAELGDRLAHDLERGFSTYGPHRDELVLRHDGRALRSYGSQGEQRLALLALLFAERDLLEQERGSLPLMLLDDVFSELDSKRRALLVGELAVRGQSVITTADRRQLPRTSEGALSTIEVPVGVVGPGPAIARASGGSARAPTSAPVFCGSAA